MATIREARAADVPAIYTMLRDSAIDQDSEHKLCADPASLLADGFGENPRFQCLLAEVEGRPAGLALYYFTFSTWTSRNGIYLEDLYVAPEFRRLGLARALMAELAGVARANNCRRLDWLVLRDNVSALRFYESIGAKDVNGDVFLMRLDPDGDL